MPQNPNQVLPALTSDNVPASLNLDDTGALKVVQSEAPPITDPVVHQTIGTITAGTGSFELAMAANPNRLPGGAIQNNSTSHAMGVVFNSHTAAVSGSAIAIPASGTLVFSQVFGGQVYKGEVAIEGTTLDTFGLLELSSS